MINSLTILGSTGSIGLQTLAVCRKYNVDVVGLAAGQNVARMLEQIIEFKPETAVMAQARAADELRAQVSQLGLSTRVLGGEEEVSRLAAEAPAEMVMCAMVGMAGLKPVVSALRAGREIALANKEALVTGGKLVMNLAREKKILIRPVDSEHSAIWQCLTSGRKRELRKIWLTASGGPFRGRTLEQMRTVTREEALDHPTWEMGAKITIDSATMMNKGLEMIEACWLFDVRPQKIDYLVHPQSVIHSMVEWQDGSVVAQLGHADMKLPIQVALAHPNRLSDPERVFNPFDPTASTLTFARPDPENFPCLRLAGEAMKAGGLMPTVLNGANEVAVASFLQDRISFVMIPELIERTMDACVAKLSDDGSLAAILEADRLARRTAGQLLAEFEGLK
ncbi:MAG: 1-deoxy-D-xylulose-5-phosphate reductoisomerase [Fastidiosipilaceae bacterium]|jgi:1-deoxy-D-xylulose-5-phosphate reductoisomerase